MAGLALAVGPASVAAAQEVGRAGAGAVATGSVLIADSLTAAGLHVAPHYLGRAGDVDIGLLGGFASFPTMGGGLAGGKIGLQARMDDSLALLADLGPVTAVGLRGLVWSDLGARVGWDARFRSEIYFAVAPGFGLTKAGFGLIPNFPGAQSNGVELALDGEYRWNAFRFYASPALVAMSNRTATGLSGGADVVVGPVTLGLGSSLQANVLNPAGAALPIEPFELRHSAGVRLFLNDWSYLQATYHLVPADTYGVPSSTVLAGIGIRMAADSGQSAPLPPILAAAPLPELAPDPYPATDPSLTPDPFLAPDTSLGPDPFLAPDTSLAPDPFLAPGFVAGLVPPAIAGPGEAGPAPLPAAPRAADARPSRAAPAKPDRTVAIVSNPIVTVRSTAAAPGVDGMPRPDPGPGPGPGPGPEGADRPEILPATRTMAADPDFAAVPPVGPFASSRGLAGPFGGDTAIVFQPEIAAGVFSPAAFSGPFVGGSVMNANETRSRDEARNWEATPWSLERSIGRLTQSEEGADGGAATVAVVVCCLLLLVSGTKSE